MNLCDRATDADVSMLRAGMAKKVFQQNRPEAEATALCARPSVRAFAPIYSPVPIVRCHEGTSGSFGKSPKLIALPATAERRALESPNRCMSNGQQRLGRARGRSNGERSRRRARDRDRGIISLPGSSDRPAAHADDPDPVIGVEVASDLAPRQIGLRMHEAMRRISEFGWHAHHRVRVVARAVLRLGCNCNRANEYQCCQHPTPRDFPKHPNST